MFSHGWGIRHCLLFNPPYHLVISFISNRRGIEDEYLSSRQENFIQGDCRWAKKLKDMEKMEQYKVRSFKHYPIHEVSHYRPQLWQIHSPDRMLGTSFFSFSGGYCACIVVTEKCRVSTSSSGALAAKALPSVDADRPRSPGKAIVAPPPLWSLPQCLQ